MQKIVFASNNAGKFREVTQAFADIAQVIPQTEFLVPDVIEDATTFVENALKKARHACQYCQLPVLADDSGLEVEALRGAPGVLSARYAGKDSDASANNKKLLHELAGKPIEQRVAQFRCVLVYLRYADDPAPIICQAIWVGRILEVAQGNAGFGYDPIFFVPERNCSAAELTMAEKNKISHRGQALQLMLQQLSK